MIQLIINTNMLREIDERKLINAYARYFYNSKEDTTNDVLIRDHLIQLFDWDKNGDNGLGVYCGKFESIKRKDWDILIQFIKDNHHEIRGLSYHSKLVRKLKSIKVVNDFVKNREQHRIERFTDENYTVSGKGKKARPCTYDGREYKSRQECMYKERLTRNQLYKYLKATNQL